VTGAEVTPEATSLTMSVGMPPMVGGESGSTVTAKVASTVPAEFVAAHVTSVSPTGNVDPDDGEQSTSTLPSASVAVGAVYDTAAPVGPVAMTVISAGTSVIVGGASTVTLNDAETVPAVFVAVQVTVVEPSVNAVPERGEHPTSTGPFRSSAVGGV